MAVARRSQEEWSELVGAWRASGQSAREFCAKRGLNRSTFGWWRWKLGRESVAETTSGGWLEVARLDAEHFVDRGTTSPDLTLVLGDGISIRVPIGFDGPTLERLIRTLGVIEC